MTHKLDGISVNLFLSKHWAKCSSVVCRPWSYCCISKKFPNSGLIFDPRRYLRTQERLFLQRFRFNHSYRRRCSNLGRTFWNGINFPPLLFFYIADTGSSGRVCVYWALGTLGLPFYLTGRSTFCWTCFSNHGWQFYYKRRVVLLNICKKHSH